MAGYEPGCDMLCKVLRTGCVLKYCKKLGLRCIDVAPERLQFGVPASLLSLLSKSEDSKLRRPSHREDYATSAQPLASGAIVQKWPK